MSKLTTFAWPSTHARQLAAHNPTSNHNVVPLEHGMPRCCKLLPWLLPQSRPLSFEVRNSPIDILCLDRLVAADKSF